MTGLRVETRDDEVAIVLTNEGSGDAFEIIIPEAGTVPTGETDPVAGVMSAEQAADLADVVSKVYPLEASIRYSNAGTFEKGSTVTPRVDVNVSRRGSGVAQQVSITTTMNVVDTQGNTPTDYIPLTYVSILLSVTCYLDY